MRGLVGRQHVRILRVNDRDATLTRRRAREQRTHGWGFSGELGEQRHGDPGVLDHRLGQRSAARFLGDEHEVDVVQTETAGGFRREHARDAELDETRPALIACARPVVVRLAQRRRASTRSASSSRTAAAIICCSSLNVKSTSAAPRQTEQPLGDDVALDLVGAGVDRARQREDEAVEPRVDIAARRRDAAAALRARRAGSSRRDAGRRSSSDQKILLRLASTPIEPPAMRRIAVMYVLSA